MRCTTGKNLRTPCYVVAGCGSRYVGCSATAATATPSAIRATTATAWERRTRVIILAGAGINTALIRQGCSQFSITLFHRRCYSHPRFPISAAAVALATTLRRNDLATVLAPHQPEVRALSNTGQLTPAVTGTPVFPQLAIPAGASDSTTAASSLFPLSVIMEQALIRTEIEIVLTRFYFVRRAMARVHTRVILLSTEIWSRVAI